MKEEGCPFIKIYDWMLAPDHHLTGNELLVYAFIHGYSVNGGGWFDSKRSLAERLKMMPSAVSRALRKLFGEGLITEAINDEGRSALSAVYNDSGPFIVVYEWMLSRGLPWRELLVYALIYGLCREKKTCYGGRGWIARRLNITNVSKVITALKEKELVWEKRNPSILATKVRTTKERTSRSTTTPLAQLTHRYY